ncbi:ATP-dependent helicase [Desulfurivibrio sp. D14AmB]|uniref:ATP-dependent helicase n=1 Tax=Desulfurivibrio sp. D14AmB TaxID=3374370 RepID=UPI00376EC8B7
MLHWPTMQPSLFPQQNCKTADSAAATPTLGLAAALAQLNSAQREAVCAPPGPLLVIAGAGSGKTRTLVHRLAWLVEQGIPPEELLLLTFTRKAAQEMVQRAGYLLNDSCRRITGGTFHATANLLLRRYARYVGYEANFTILDQGDAEGIVNLLKSSLGLGGAGKRFPSRRLILAILSKAVNVGATVSDLVEAEHGHLVEFLDDILAINEHYHKFKQAHGLMDYDDLLLYWRRLLRENREVREELAGRFQAILVDEYQDTNPIQAEIVRLMAAPRNHVMAVGDDAQSIYSFRGADFRNIMEFPEHFPGTRLIRLEENYRSTSEILEVGNAIIAPAPVRYPKKLFSKLTGGVKPVLHAARNEGGQARFVVEKILTLRREGVGDEQMAVLFRSGFHSYKLELELTAHGIPFEKRGGQKLTESAHIKDVLSYFRVLCNPADRLSWNRILLLIDKVGPKTARNIIDRLPLGPDPGGVAPGSDPLLAAREALAAYPAGKSWQGGMKRLLTLLEDLGAAGPSPAILLELVLVYYQPVFQRLYPDDYPRRQRDLEQLRPLLAGYEDIRDFLADAALDPPGAEGEAGETGGRLVLSTVHSAKGLEWDTVFVIHLVEGKFPSGQAAGPEQYEEERRLLYVAATRAKNRLFLVYPREAMGVDRRSAYCDPSSFLAPLPPGLLAATAGSAPQPHQSSGDGASRFLPSSASDRVAAAPHGGATGGLNRAGAEAEFAVGARVKHPFFGLGVLEKRSGLRTVEVNFDRHGRKTLHLDYAKLEQL